MLLARLLQRRRCAACCCQVSTAPVDAVLGAVNVATLLAVKGFHLYSELRAGAAAAGAAAEHTSAWHAALNFDTEACAPPGCLALLHPDSRSCVRPKQLCKQGYGPTKPVSWALCFWLLLGSRN